MPFEDPDVRFFEKPEVRFPKLHDAKLPEGVEISQKNRELYGGMGFILGPASWHYEPDDKRTVKLKIEMEEFFLRWGDASPEKLPTRTARALGIDRIKSACNQMLRMQYFHDEKSLWKPSAVRCIACGVVVEQIYYRGKPDFRRFFHEMAGMYITDANILGIVRCHWNKFKDFLDRDMR